ncbi:hypothetical protein PBAT_11495 [Paenibacillus antarcticus]|uniref:Uncharacterized protein n=1 Tax=Paenibacillus antarcticus TaxID=253703 RepID=A0A168PC31_9BACL|nr:hypothetical protein PBAT_11495 [Paenibacillus antarcticus]
MSFYYEKAKKKAIPLGSLFGAILKYKKIYVSLDTPFLILFKTSPIFQERHFSRFYMIHGHSFKL